MLNVVLSISAYVGLVAALLVMAVYRPHEGRDLSDDDLARR